jgi:hypothetical protein
VPLQVMANWSTSTLNGVERRIVHRRQTAKRSIIQSGNLLLARRTVLDSEESCLSVESVSRITLGNTQMPADPEPLRYDRS